jgi:hypothetical protein
MYLDEFYPASEVLLDARPRTGGGPVRRMGEPSPARGELPGAARGPEDAPGVLAAQIESYAPERVVVRATAERAGFLVLNELYHPGWRARVDGVEAEVMRGNHMFRAVPLGPGSHEVEFIFDPDSVRAGRTLSLAALGVLGAGLLAAWRWPVRKRV